MRHEALLIRMGVRDRPSPCCRSSGVKLEAVIVSCGFCWARSGSACDQEGLHLARYVRAFRRGLIGQEDLAVVCEAPRVSAGQVVVGVPTPVPGKS